MDHNLRQALKSMPNVEFKKISYDRILGDMTASYLESHPDVPFHEVIDIIRPMADQDYLDQIARHFDTPASDEKTLSTCST